MLIAISSIEFDLAGHVSINTLPDNTDGETRRRVNRVATLDGGIAINDRGCAEGDRTLVYTWRTVSKAHNDAIDRLVKNYAQVHVSTPSGVYLASPEVFTAGVAESEITLLVLDKLT